MTAICCGLLEGQLETLRNLGQLRWLREKRERLLTVRSPGKKSRSVSHGRADLLIGATRTPLGLQNDEERSAGRFMPPPPSRCPRLSECIQDRGSAKRHLLIYAITVPCNQSGYHPPLFSNRSDFLKPTEVYTPSLARPAGLLEEDLTAAGKPVSTGSGSSLGRV
ncbi:unnamed protein product [Pleuronectes platessa]|uniref:Uncharacterized protein n=1 Tax=Pleuronectes platessa TaxID=8262 RepID=A0A9N7YW35_PLEPL|nr:unnamed protein product [Pleuronectes platessa]